MTKHKKLLIALTGGVGAGKTTALGEFKRLGARTISLDQIAREQARRGGEAYKKIISAFGPGALDSRGALDRAALGRRVFKNPKLRRRLERITHPLILRRMRRETASARGVVIVDVPLLFESGLQKLFDAVVAVSAPLETRLRRAAARDDSPPGQIRARARAQVSESERLRRADVCISNSGRPADFRRTIQDYWKALRLILRSSQGDDHGKHDQP